MNEAQFWLGFSAISNIGSYRLAPLWHAFGDMATAWEAPIESIYLSGLTGKALASISVQRAQINPEHLLAKVSEAGAYVVTLADRAYPPLLRSTHNAPGLLYAQGTLLPDDSAMLAVVGTRTTTDEGLALTTQMTGALVAHSITIVSGLAMGIEAAAHQGALDAGGRTIAVLANGVDVLYPTQHRELAARICQQGALISEFPLGAHPIKRNFPRRSQTLSGMCAGVLVMEAPARSGSLYAARSAAEQGRPVFVVDALMHRDHENAAGLRALAQSGAYIIRDADELLSALQGGTPAAGDPAPNPLGISAQTAPAPDGLAIETAHRLDPNENWILTLLGAQPTHTDDLAREMGVSPLVILGIMTTLEMEGLVEAVGFSKYRLAR